MPKTIPKSIQETPSADIVNVDLSSNTYSDFMAVKELRPTSCLELEYWTGISSKNVVPNRG
jgi:hypothetical protein